MHVVLNIVSHFSYCRSVPLPHPLPPKVTNHMSVLLGLENQKSKWMEGQVEAKLTVQADIIKKLGSSVNLFAFSNQSSRYIATLVSVLFH